MQILIISFPKDPKIIHQFSTILGFGVFKCRKYLELTITQKSSFCVFTNVPYKVYYFSYKMDPTHPEFLSSEIFGKPLIVKNR